jgi:cytochrome c oxidase subunit 2
VTPQLGLFPHEASNFAGSVDWITIGLLLLCGGILLLVGGLIVTFGILYRKGSPRSREIRLGGARALEWSWTVVTFFIFIGLYVWSAVVFVRMHVPPPGATEITVVGKQWMWKFQHPGGKRELGELHLPMGVPILLTMTSEDVIHSFFVPAFRLKQDVLPGRYSHLWFQADRAGAYRLFCTQYCGTAHAGMQGFVIVQSPADYQRWLQTGIPDGTDAARLSTAESMPSRGSRLFTRLGCISCHGNNAGVSAPELAGIYGKPVGLSDGSTVTVDEDYLRESILNPNAKIVQGYQAVMPSFAGLIGEEDVLDLIAYLKSIKATPQATGGETP